MVITRQFFGLNKVTFWDRRSQCCVLMRLIMGRNNVRTGEVDIWSYQEELWDIMM